jgi:5-formyltetrahydrofolate cyclo-ligase
MYMLHANTRKAAERLDLMLIPGVGFDRQGNRLGRGAGYYDRFLSSMPNRPFLVGLAFQEQLLDEVPTERHDVPMDIVLYDEFDASQVI